MSHCKLSRELSNRVMAGLGKHDMSQRELARRVGITEKHLSFMLAGKGHKVPTGSVTAWDQLLAVVEAPVKEKLT